MAKRKLRALLVAGLMIMLCTALLVTGTFALFSSEAKVENHLQAGTLTIKLERTHLVKNRLDDVTGYMKTEENNITVDFTAATTENIFGIGENELVAPTSSYEATMKLSNTGSVAFDYVVNIKLTSVSNALAEQMKVYVDGVDTGKHLSDFVADGSGNLAAIASGKMAKNDAAKTFTIKIEFENLANDVNNNAKDKVVEFDMIVTAVQRTAE